MDKKDDFSSEPTYVPDAEGERQEIKEASPEKLKKRAKDLAKEREEYLEGWQRERAAFINYRKEQEKRQEELKFYATEDILRSLLEVMDNLVLADKHAPPEVRKDKWFEGLKHIEKQFIQILSRYGVEEVKAEGEKFDPAAHETMGEVESDKAPGTIVEVLRKGYKMGDIVLRPARIKTAKPIT